MSEDDNLFAEMPLDEQVPPETVSSSQAPAATEYVAPVPAPGPNYFAESLHDSANAWAGLHDDTKKRIKVAMDDDKQMDGNIHTSSWNKRIEAVTGKEAQQQQELQQMWNDLDMFAERAKATGLITYRDLPDPSKVRSGQPQAQMKWIGWCRSEIKDLMERKRQERTAAADRETEDKINELIRDLGATLEEGSGVLKNLYQP